MFCQRAFPANHSVLPGSAALENVTGLISILEPESLSAVEHKEVELFHEDDHHQVNEVIEKIHRRIIGTIIDDINKAGYLLPQLADSTPIVPIIPACALGAPTQKRSGMDHRLS